MEDVFDIHWGTVDTSLVWLANRIDNFINEYLLVHLLQWNVYDVCRLKCAEMFGVRAVEHGSEEWIKWRCSQRDECEIPLIHFHDEINIVSSGGKNLRKICAGTRQSEKRPFNWTFSFFIILKVHCIISVVWIECPLPDILSMLFSDRRRINYQFDRWRELNSSGGEHSQKCFRFCDI